MDHPKPEPPSRSRLIRLTIGAIGVVYGDIGTSPLYAIKECFSVDSHANISAGNTEVLGVLSLIFWALTIIISIKYLGVIMRFDNKGEGGILALMELISTRTHGVAKMTFIFAIGLFGAALLYGDGIITPAISVLSATEGLLVAAPSFEPMVLPVTVAILFGLFFAQRNGTGKMGRIFGPFMLFWFGLMSVLGIVSIIQSPYVLAAVNPWHAFYFLTHHDLSAFLVLGSVFLVVTGGETVYADMGHFGKTAIRRGWFSLVYPALLLNYFGQGALLLREGTIPSTVSNPFFHLVPSWGVIPLVVCATLATIIASQAVIAGAFSLTWQALQLGYLPRMKVTHTSGDERGQIYIPFINWTLFAGTVLVVLQFRSSGNLASAYGIAVTTTMVITTVLGWFAMRRLFRWNIWIASAISVVFVSIDLAFFSANITKVLDGGWLPLLVGGIVYLVMVTWHRGRELLRLAIEKRNQTLGSICLLYTSPSPRD